MSKQGRRGGSQRQSYWQEVVRRWREGGQSVRAFCQAEGLREAAFYFWRRELDRRGPQAEAENVVPCEAGAVTSATGSRKRMPSRHGATAAFLPVRVVEHTAMEVARGVEIALACGHTLRVPAGFDRQTLADVLAVLEVRPC